MSQQAQSEFSLFANEVRQDLRAIKAVFKPIAASHTPIDKFPLEMRLDQVAAHLNCSAQHVRNLIEEGKLQAINIAPGKPRKHLRINRDSVAKFKSTQHE